VGGLRSQDFIISAETLGRIQNHSPLNSLCARLTTAQCHSDSAVLPRSLIAAVKTGLEGKMLPMTRGEDFKQQGGRGTRRHFSEAKNKRSEKQQLNTSIELARTRPGAIRDERIILYAKRQSEVWIFMFRQSTV
jgi:hypothetical protein